MNKSHLPGAFYTFIFTTSVFLSTNTYASSFSSNTVLNLDAGSSYALCLLEGCTDPILYVYTLEGSYFGHTEESRLLYANLDSGHSIRLDSNSLQFSQELSNLQDPFSRDPLFFPPSTLTVNLTTVIDDFGQTKSLDIASWILENNGLHTLSGSTTLVCELSSCEDGSRFTIDSSGIALGLSGAEDINYDFHFEGTISSVPLPTTVWLFGSGLLGLIGFARRKTHS